MAPVAPLALLVALAAAGPSGPGVRHDSGWSFDPADRKAEGGRFPQLRDADRLYRAARRDPGVLDGRALLLCRVSVNDPRRWDLLRGPDLRVWLRLDGRPAGVGWGPEDAGTAVVSFPGVALRPGARVVVGVEDRDATGTDAIGTVTLDVGRGGALEREGETFAVRCAALGESRWRPRFEKAADVAASSLRALARVPAPDLTRPGAGWPWRELAEAQRAVEEMAAFAGWAEPQVRIGVQAVEDTVKAWPKRLAAAVRNAERTAVAPGAAARVDGANVRLADVRCGNKALKPWRRKRSGGEGRAAPLVAYLADTARCVYLLEIEAGKMDLRLQAGRGGARELGELVVYTRGGGSTSLVPIDYLRDGASVPEGKVALDPGEKATIVAVPAALVRRSQARLVVVTGAPGAVLGLPR